MLDQIWAITTCLGRQELKSWETRDAAARCVRHWAKEFALFGVEDPEQADFRISLLGELMAADSSLEEVQKAAREAPLPTAPFKHPDGADPLQSWLRVSPTFWFGAVSRQIDRDREALEPKKWSAIASAEDAAYRQAARRGITGPWLDELHEYVRVLDLVFAKDDDTLATTLRQAGELDIKAQRENIVMAVIASARFVSLDRWQEIIGLWGDHIGRRTSWFAIAWGAIIEQSPHHGLFVAEEAVRRYPDDTEFAAELSHMRTALRDRGLLDKAER